MTKDQMLTKFREEVFCNSDKIDPCNERVWSDLACGFFLGLGASIEVATDYELECAADRGCISLEIYRRERGILPRNKGNEEEKVS